MDVVSIFVLVLVLVIFASEYVSLESIKKFFTKDEEEKPVIWPDDPTPDLHPHDITIVGIVSGWNCFKAQCKAAELDEVVSRLDEIFPMLIKVDEDALRRGE